MENIKLLQLLAKLSKQEFLSLGFYLKTPSFNKNTKLISLYEALSSYAPSFIAKKIDAAEIFKQIYPKLEFNNIKLNHLCSLLTICTQNFLASIELRKEEYIKERLLLKRYDNKKFTDDFKIETKNFKNHLNQKRPLDLSGHYHDFWLERSAYYHPGNIKKESKKNQQKLEGAFNNLNNFYFLARLELTCEMANRQNINIDNYDSKYFKTDFLPDFINPHKPIENISNSIELYAIIFSTLKNKNIEDGLKKVPKINRYLNSIKISQTEKSILSVWLTSFITNSLSKYPYKGRIAYAELFMSKLDAGEFIKGGYVNHMLVINLAFIGMGINRLDITYEVRNKYGDKVVKEKKEAVLNLINAVIAYGEKKYENCLDSLNLIYDNDVEIKVNVDLLYIRTYYELLKTDDKSAEKLFYIFCNRYKKYIRQTKGINAQRKNNNLALIISMKELVLHYKNKANRSLIDYQIEIKESNNPFKIWFEQKIEEIALIRGTTSSK